MRHEHSRAYYYAKALLHPIERLLAKYDRPNTQLAEPFVKAVEGLRSAQRKMLKLMDENAPHVDSSSATGKRTMRSATLKRKARKSSGVSTRKRTAGRER